MIMDKSVNDVYNKAKPAYSQGRSSESAGMQYFLYYYFTTFCVFCQHVDMKAAVSFYKKIYSDFAAYYNIIHCT